MRRPLIPGLIFSVSILMSLFLSIKSNPTDSLKPVPVDRKHRGVSWVASGPVSEEDFLRLVENDVNWIAQTPFGWQQDYNSPTLQLATVGRILWGERDEGIEETTRLAKKHGIKTLLKPHIWLRNRNDGKWRSDIEMKNEEDWQSWFYSYRTFILHYARLAEANGIEALSVGTELHATIKNKPGEWRRIISEIREIYGGELTYSANWYKEFEEVEFWDDLDFIGVQAYFPLSEKENPTLDELKKGWRPHLEAIEKIHKKHQKPVLFTEIGYRSSVDSAIKPWEWRRRGLEELGALDLQTQANCYEAFFQSVWHKEWLAGAYFWKWFPGRERFQIKRRDLFSPQNNPAEKVMARWYGDRLLKNYGSDTLEFVR